MLIHEQPPVKPLDTSEWTVCPDNVQTVLEGFERRRNMLLEREAARPIESEHFAAHAVLALNAGRAHAQANAEIRRWACWFDRPLPATMSHQGECDFVALKLCRAYHQFLETGRLESATLEAISRFFSRHDFASIYQSENHALLFHVSRCLMAQALPAAYFDAYGVTGSDLLPVDQEWLKDFLRYRARCGWGEFDSLCYLLPVWECLACLYDFSNDAELVHLVDMMMNLLLADMAVDCINGYYGGAHGRIYPCHALNHDTAPTRFLYFLHFGGQSPDPDMSHSCLADILSCCFRAQPAVVDIALNRPRAYENRERKHLHNLADVLPVEPIEGSIRKYSFVTEDFLLGCVQHQDAYPKREGVHHPHHAVAPAASDQRQTAAYAHHQQHQWDLSFATRPDARLFTHHPGTDPSHNHWTGDRLCGCGSFFQYRGVLLALYDIPPDAPCQFIHAYMPRAAFDEMAEIGDSLYVRAGDAYAALTLCGGYQWTTDGEWAHREVVAQGARHGVVCEAAMGGQFVSLEDFVRAMQARTIRFDSQRLELRYRGEEVGTLYLDGRGCHQHNGRDMSLDYPTYDSPLLQSDWGSGRIGIHASFEDLTLDFN